MPVKIPDDLPGRMKLEEEHVFVMSTKRALSQDIRPLHLLILNLMPTKIATETQLLRCLTNTPLQIEIDFCYTASYTSKNISKSYLKSFYKCFDEIKHKKYDGMIITGAPVETLKFEYVDYWAELCSMMEWSKTHVHSTLHICWGAQAGLYYHYGIAKRMREKKLFGVFSHEVNDPYCKLFQGFDDLFNVPHSSFSEIEEKALQNEDKLKIVASSKEAGIHVLTDLEGKQVFVMGHAEYDTETLAQEYWRDKEKNTYAALPVHYFEDDDVRKLPQNTWRAHADLFFTNWINYFVYQTAPYELD